MVWNLVKNVGKELFKSAASGAKQKVKDKLRFFPCAVPGCDYKGFSVRGYKQHMKVYHKIK